MGYASGIRLLVSAVLNFLSKTKFRTLTIGPAVSRSSISSFAIAALLVLKSDGGTHLLAGGNFSTPGRGLAAWSGGAWRPLALTLESKAWMPPASRAAATGAYQGRAMPVVLALAAGPTDGSVFAGGFVGADCDAAAAASTRLR